MTYRDYNHAKAQKAGKARDLYTCQVCGSQKDPEGHHIIDYQFGGAADIENIVTLCQKCHREVHKGSIDIVKF